MKKRLDQYLADEGLFESRARAKSAVMEGCVSVDGNADLKPGSQVSGDEEIVISSPEKAYVSRGGIKLAHALEAFRIDVRGAVALDVGSSTGGFTDCLLDRGASRVIALDVGKGQLHWKLREDPRVMVIEGYNARDLDREDLPATPDLAVVDVSFISLEKVLEPVFGVLAPGGEAVVLVKPQFEAGRKQVERGGVVRDPLVHISVLEGLAGWLGRKGLAAAAVSVSPLKGPKGNIEFFYRVTREGVWVTSEQLEREVRRAHGW
jgi:23S rRNA (cytidine1920-2'-O)/16S rRNA (cytidine1409-2'-O)-methyltransferase